MVNLGAIVSTLPPGREECADGRFTTSQGPGRCSRHGGVSMPTSRRRRTPLSPEAKFRRDAATAPKVIFIPDPNQSNQVAQATLPKSAKPAYEGRCRFRNKECRELDEKFGALRTVAYDKGIVDDNLFPNTQPRTPEQFIGKLIRDINAGILSITIKEEPGTIAYLKRKLEELEDLIKKQLSPQQPVEEQQPAPVAHVGPLAGVENDIPYQLAYNAHRGTSFSPELRAKQEIEGHVSYMTELYNELSAGRTPEQLRLLDAEFLTFRKRYSERRRAILHRRTGIMSMMITGGSNFPVRQQNKRRDADHKAYGEFIAWEEKALGAIRKNGDIYPERKAKQPIRSGSSTAIQQLEDKLQKLERYQEVMKLANKIIRSKKDVTARLISEAGFTEAQALEMQQPDFAGRVGVPDYMLTNNNAEIRRTRQRLEAEKQNQEARAEEGEKRTDFDGGHILENIEANRLQIIFDSIPSAALRDKLKGRGFRWSPSNQAWQRQLTKDAIWAANTILGIDSAAAVVVPAPASLPPSMKPATNTPARIPEGGVMGFDEWGKTMKPAEYARWERLGQSQGTGLKQAMSVGRRLREDYEKYLKRVTAKIEKQAPEQINKPRPEQLGMAVGDIVKTKIYYAYLPQGTEGKITQFEVDNHGNFFAKLYLNTNQSGQEITRRVPITAIEKQQQPAEPVKQSSGVNMIPIEAINIRRDWFQNRATPYSERSVESIVQAAMSGSFRWSQLDPVTLWVGPDGKLYMLSGHSRLEAFDRLCRAGAVVDGQTFCNIPAKIEANISLEEAKRIALESNTLSTKETELERAEYYRAMRMQGRNADNEAKRLEGDNWSTVLALSYLNPSGKTYTTLRALENGDATSKGNIRTIARWIGNARAKYGSLTNFHEDELYTWLVDNTGYGTRTGQISNERDFNNRLASIINRRSTFGQLEDSLNIIANVTLSPVEAQYNQQLAEASEKVKALQKMLDDKIKEYRNRAATENQILELTAPISAQLTRARIEYQALLQKKGDVTQYAKQEVNLFANLSGHRARRKHMTA